MLPCSARLVPMPVAIRRSVPQKKESPQPGQRPHQRRLDVVDRRAVHLLLLAVFLLHRRSDAQQQGDDMRRGVEEHQVAF